MGGDTGDRYDAACKFTEGDGKLRAIDETILFAAVK